MNKFYLHTLPQPFHLSVGALLFDDDLRICVHHFQTRKLPEDKQYHGGNLNEFYILMRESVEGEENLFQAVHRGLSEEFGATGTIERFLGTIDCSVTTPRHTFQKTTLYHAVRLKELGERPLYDEESTSNMEWHAPKDLLPLLEEQARRTDKMELDERVIIQRFKEAYGI